LIKETKNTTICNGTGTGKQRFGTIGTDTGIKARKKGKIKNCYEEEARSLVTQKIVFRKT
jgi:hypothetical protein